MIENDNFDAIVVGGGFYGARLALMLRSVGGRVTLVEREPTLLARASLRNQARVHQGYHYPRSILTSLRSRRNYARFVDEYSDCVDRSFPHYYAIARGTSKTTGPQFAEVCRRIGAPASVAPAAVVRLFDSSRIEAVFEVQECAFDGTKLRARLERDLATAGVDVLLNTEAVRLGSRPDGRGHASNGHEERIGVELRTGSQSREMTASLVLNCAYSRINRMLVSSGASVIPLKHELTELALVEPPDELGGAAVTVMDGPFFSLMPYPSRGLFTLSHVRYTPHCAWHDQPDTVIRDGDAFLEAPVSRFVHMVRDAERYLPAMRQARYVDSVWEIKTLMPRSEWDDSRPILLRRSPEYGGLLTTLGAKIDSVYDAEDALRSLLSSQSGRARPAPAEAALR